MSNTRLKLDQTLHFKNLRASVMTGGESKSGAVTVIFFAEGHIFESRLTGKPTELLKQLHKTNNS